MNPNTFIGSVGAAIILLAFYLSQTRKLNQDSLWYDALNLFGSGILVAYSILLSSVPFLLLNGVWFLISLRDVILDVRRKLK
ncbi:MAG: Uncharacterized protein G01um101419_844 [Parcubacteria group bacterium Gr01-1014_19]|nr:MAG: Uncharacterized protein G01um101419_844 [Parcubacteria group bacterium Gr01-1014_19]